MNRAAVILAVVSALCLGAAFGFMGGVMFSHHMLRNGHLPMFPGPGMHEGPPWGMRHGPGMRGMPSPRAILPHLRRMLDLTPAQADAIRAEIERTRGDFDTVRDSLHARIERHLTPEQRERFRRMRPGTDDVPPGGFAPRSRRAEPGDDPEGASR